MLIAPLQLDRPTYVVIAMPPEVAAHVAALRAKYRPAYERLPVEITVIGSSGVGVLDADQSSDDVVHILETVATRTAPFRVRFEPLTTFPNTNVCYFPPVPADPFKVLQASLVSGGLRAGSSPYPYSPHLTMARLDDATKVAEVLAAIPPPGEYLLDQLAVYSQVGRDTRLHYKTQLRGATRVA
jgi:2'-5' RNA ligase